ncbi:Na+/H+ antiporter subunit E [Caldimonas tepidiphila]|uniref:Na+/H+ antiporter subunit E n=1 Tax=Caldimonas tepidiphila TaxID=2315841 RepID=UPI000E5A1AD4|nr:Na+/H+ antiporter subunit E [Caldimonas tepidiphila]
MSTKSASVMDRWLPHPVITLLIVASWLLLMQSFRGPDIFWAVLIGLVVPKLLGDFLPVRVHLRVGPALRLMRIVLWDIIVANIAVARLVLGPMSRPRPAWIEVPLTATHPTAIALFAAIITTTPGTVSCVIDEERRLILVHALDAEDPQAMATDMKRRYEDLLIDIFEHGNLPGRTA